MNSSSELVITVVLPIAISFVMFGLGLGLTGEDFKRLRQYPKLALIGLITKLVAMPLIAFALAYAYGLKPPYAIGLVMTAAGPASVVANVFTSMARGNVAFSLTFTALDNFIGAVNLPLFTVLAANVFAQKDESVGIQLVDSIRIFLLIAVPVSLGMLVRAKFPGFARKGEKVLGVYAIVLLICLAVMVFMKERQHVMETIGVIGFPTFLLAILGMIVGLALTRVLKLSIFDGAALTFLLPMQGTAVVMTVALTVFGGIDYVMSPGIYSLFMYPLGFAGVWLFRRMK